MGLYNSDHLCPFCNVSNTKTSHYPNCTQFKPLWEYIFTKIFKINFQATELASYLRYEGTCEGSHIIISYAIVTIYKASHVKLNNFSADFNFYDHFRQLLFNRLLSEFNIIKFSNGIDSIFMQIFLSKWQKFSLFSVKNSQIFIQLPRI